MSNSFIVHFMSRRCINILHSKKLSHTINPEKKTHLKATLNSTDNEYQHSNLLNRSELATSVTITITIDTGAVFSYDLAIVIRIVTKAGLMT